VQIGMPAITTNRALPWTRRPADGDFKVTRGGAWDISELGTRTTSRIHYDVGTQNADHGFGCVRSN